MYKVGEKVETPHGVGKVNAYDATYDIYLIDLLDGFVQQQYKLEHLKPYVSAHDKLLALGYEFSKRNDYVIYTHDELSRVTIYRDKTYSCGGVNLELSRILTQYLEELEE